MRDGALSMRTYMEINDNNYDTVKDHMMAYEQWVEKVQGKTDENVDVRVEPKFTIPDGNPYDGGWCRPQTDGPGLRAGSLAIWGLILLDNNQEDHARTVTWPTIQQDLGWVMDNWSSSGCDLWEEIRSEDFFWGRMGFVNSLNIAANFSDRIGAGLGDQYRDKANEIKDTLSKHWTGEYLYESTNREKDGAVIHAIATFGTPDMYGPSTEETAKTIAVWNDVFCLEYPINQNDNKAGIPGMLYGRYPGDSYAGGNPWQLLTAVVAETYYKAALEFRDQSRKCLGSSCMLYLRENDRHIRAWFDHLRLGERGSFAKGAVLAELP